LPPLNPNRTKIVATLGPASRAVESIRDLIKAGVDVFRLNSAHSDHRTLVRDIQNVRSVARSLRAGVGVLVDLQGPKIRVGAFRDAEPIWLARGMPLVISTEPGVIGQARDDGGITRVGCGYRDLAKHVRAKERLLLDDGNIEVMVTKVSGNEIHTKVLYGGLLKQHKGINAPGADLSSMQSLSPKDRADLRVALDAGVDFIAQSFVRTADDVVRLKKLIADHGSDAFAIAKIERREATKNLAAIIEVADGIMVARGDMGVELGPEAVPALQKRIIRLCMEARKPVITATQMLESMITNPRPTRAEASDVANAIYDGTSAVMLSAETASGRHPIRAARFMEQIVRRTEEDMFSHWEYVRRRRASRAAVSVTMATAQAAAYAAHEAAAKLIAVFTESGRTAQILSAERTPTRVVAFTPFQRTVQRLTLTWGIVAVRSSRTRTSHEMTLEGERIIRDRGLAKKGERLVFLFGGTRMLGVTNIMKIGTIS
jgi:pyruvate kinase